MICHRSTVGSMALQDPAEAGLSPLQPADPGFHGMRAFPGPRDRLGPALASSYRPGNDWVWLMRLTEQGVAVGDEVSCAQFRQTAQQGSSPWRSAWRSPSASIFGERDCSRLRLRRRAGGVSRRWTCATIFPAVDPRGAARAGRAGRRVGGLSRSVGGLAVSACAAGGRGLRRRRARSNRTLCTAGCRACGNGCGHPSRPSAGKW